jgi:hypothetical protein
MLEIVHDRVTTGVPERSERLLYCDVESKWKNYHIITIPGYSLPETQTNARCLLWRQNSPEVNYSDIPISGGGGVSREDTAR